ncbi:MAG: hypothetical protein H6732_01890 [Alphaproteobacteria bacterium]|nr:hypothetical protein [Alphaproteobacteria bacterium]
MLRGRSVGVLVGLLTSTVASAADTLRCGTLMDLVDRTPMAQLLLLVETNEVDEKLLGCLTRREAPAALVEAVEARLDGEPVVPGDVVVVEPSEETWPELAGDRLAQIVRLRLARERPVLFLVDPETSAPGWIWERQDRILSALLGALPEGSQAAEDPSVLGDDGLLLLDPAHRDEAVARVERMGFRELVVLHWSSRHPGNVVFEVRQVDAETTRFARARLVQADQAEVEVEVALEGVTLTVEVELEAARVGEPYTLTARSSEVPSTARVAVEEGGRHLGWMSRVDDSTWTLVEQLPAHASERWSLDLVLVSNEVVLARTEVRPLAGASLDAPRSSPMRETASAAAAHRPDQGRRAQVLVRAAFRFSQGPWGQAHHTGLLLRDGTPKEFQQSPRSGDILQQSALQLNVNDLVAAGEFELGYGVLPWLDVTFVVGVLASPFRWQFFSEIDGAPQREIPDPASLDQVISDPSWYVGNRVTFAPLPAKLVRPTASIGWAYWDGRSIASVISPLPDSYVAAWMAGNNLVVLRAGAGLEADVWRYLSVFARVDIDVPVAGQSFQNWTGLSSGPFVRQDEFTTFYPAGGLFDAPAALNSAPVEWRFAAGVGASIGLLARIPTRKR